MLLIVPTTHGILQALASMRRALENPFAMKNEKGNFKGWEDDAAWNRGIGICEKYAKVNLDHSGNISPKKTHTHTQYHQY